MHYANGRAAKNGDKVVLIQQYEGKVYASTIGILYDAIPYNDTCNGRLAVISPSDPTPNLKECLHLDDVLAALPLPKDISNVPQAQAPPDASDAGESAGSTSGESSGSSASGGSSGAASSASGSGTPESSSSSTSSGSAAGGTSSASSTSGAS